jgi:diguanylate cyclase (GGDEF)-like protein
MFMAGAGFILAINLCVAGLFAGAFLFVALKDRTNLPARWFAATFALGMANFVAEWLLPLFASPRVMGYAAFALSLAALGCFSMGLAIRYGRPGVWKLIVALFVASLVVLTAIYDLPRGTLLRQVLYQAPYFGMQAMGAWVVLTASRRTRTDTAVGILVLLSALHFLSKPFIAMLAGGVGARPQDYIGTLYALYSQTMGSVLMVGTGLILLGLLMRDMLAEIRKTSVTDTLSGLLNRRGFEEQGAPVLAAMQKAGVPVSLVICDLDHFKAINDSFGHGAGDRVIAGFAGLLREATTGRHIAGRIGGEEFAVVLAGVNAASARLFAEGVRNAYAYLEVEGIERDPPPTASFGVAEAQRADTLHDLMNRADGALYAAKEAGRNCVRVGDPRPARRAFRDRV